MGTIVATLATLPLMWVGPGTSYLLLALILVARGIGMGSSVQPAIAAAFAVLRPDEVPRASSALNALQRIGGSIGTALIAVVLQHQARLALPATSGSSGGLLAPLPGGTRAELAGPLATAFGHTFAWTAALPCWRSYRPLCWPSRSDLPDPPNVDCSRSLPTPCGHAGAAAPAGYQKESPGGRRQRPRRTPNMVAPQRS